MDLWLNGHNTTLSRCVVRVRIPLDPQNIRVINLCRRYWFETVKRLGCRQHTTPSVYDYLENNHRKQGWKLEVRFFLNLQQILGSIPSVLYTVERVIGCMWVQPPSTQQKKNKKKFKNILVIQKIVLSLYHKSKTNII